MNRIRSIDIVRGIVMIIMALDHTRDLIHVDSISQQPTNLLTTTPLLFFTRWITHLCAPTFVFLAGTSAYLSFKGQVDVAASRRFLLTRGIWLVILEFTLVNFGVWFDIHFNVLLFDVIAAIGVGFIVLSLLIKASVKTIAIIGFTIIFLHDLAPLVPLPESSFFKQVLMPLFGPAAFPFDEGRLFIMGYPPIPWLGILLTGFAAGRLFENTEKKRRAIFLKSGAISLAFFLVVRGFNIYGDPVPWSSQKNGVFTFLSFMNVTKYPPSLEFTLVTLGCMFLLLALAEGLTNAFARITTVYGKVPLFYFLVHWYIIHPIMFLIVFLQGYHSSDLVFGTNFGRPKGTSGVELGWVYLIWLVVVAALYPLCKWYGQYKEQHREKRWLRYL
ncbi:DUF1624 domain-containing protein [Flavisolibacter nicotianae]|uniref:DUF1624 domain-containing protein n=1 Tax=Flavisolibacter nicotianae TaxID=2364882 RepID=UPI000EAEE510|nr:heparan-alpha-glucosaminide N-acetyltransferase domain-containing protein [Flavisolibacter nicotianae]